MNSPSATGNLSQHWSSDQRGHTLSLRRLPDEETLQNVLSESVGGGSEHGQLIVVSGDLFRADWLRIEDKGPLPPSRVHHQLLAVLDVDGQAVSGFTRKDFLAWLSHRLVLQADAINGCVQLTTAPLTGQFQTPLY